MTELRDSKAAELDALAGQTGDGAFSRAARVLRGGRIGRPTIDDGRALAMVEAFLREGLAKTKHEACQFVAQLIDKPNRVPATRDRLRRKLRTKR